MQIKQDANIEHLVLSGQLFGGGSRSSSPLRSPSPDHGWPHRDNDDNDGGDGDSDDSDVARSKQIDRMLGGVNGESESIGMGPGRTGVKGVIRDRHEADALRAARRAKAVHELNQRMEKASLGGLTYLEEQGEREREKRDMLGRRREGRFGHLREVGRSGFVSAVEDEERGVWVVVHLYDPVSGAEFFVVVAGS